MATLGRYELRDRLGRGGFATVYRAWDPRLEREVALKALSLDLSEEPDVRRRFLAEARTLARLHHPHIVTVFDVEDMAERPFFTMEIIEGWTLLDRLSGGVRLDLAEVERIITPLAEALDALHDAGLVHRDIKASNVMIERTGRVVLMDLGIARQLDGPQYTSRSMILLSPETAAPEQIAGLPVGPAADIYALGVVTYQLLAGRPPFVGDTAALLYAHAHETPPRLWELRPGLPGPVYAAVARALEKDPAKRPSTGRQFAAMVRDGLPPPPPSAPAWWSSGMREGGAMPAEATLVAPVAPATGAASADTGRVSGADAGTLSDGIRLGALVCAVVAGAGAFLPWVRGNSGIESSGVVRAVLPWASEHGPPVFFRVVHPGDGWLVLAVAAVVAVLVASRRLPVLWLAGFAVIAALVTPTVTALVLFSFGYLSGSTAPLTDAWGLLVVLVASVIGGVLAAVAVPTAWRRVAWPVAALCVVVPLLLGVAYYRRYWGY